MLRRWSRSSVNHDPDEFGDLDGVDFDELDQRDLDVGGFGVNAGLTWRW